MLTKFFGKLPVWSRPLITLGLVVFFGALVSARTEWGPDVWSVGATLVGLAIVGWAYLTEQIGRAAK